MPDLDILLTFIIMGVLFVRQVVIFRQPNKINYAPLLLGVGGIGAMTHLLLNPENEIFITLFRESMLPFFAGLMLFIIMNIMRQIQQQQMTIDQHDFTESLLDQVTQLKAYIGVLEENQNRLRRQEDVMKHDMKVIFEKEINALHTIQENQNAFIEQIESITSHQQESLKNFQTFTQKELPDIDNVIHRHIDLFRISEQDHFNQIRKMLEQSEHAAVGEKLDLMQQSVSQLSASFNKAAENMVVQARREIKELLADFSRQLHSLRSQTEGIATSLSEDETIMQDVREQSQIVMKQMVLSAQQMSDILNDSEHIKDIYDPLGVLTREITVIQSDYVTAKLQLDRLTEALKTIETEQLVKMEHYIEDLGEKLRKEVGESMDRLHEHYYIAQKDISKSVQELSSRSKIQQSYQGDLS